MENKGRGRPVLNEGQKDIREKFKVALKKASPKAIKTILEIMQDSTCRSVDRLRAAEFILQHTFGTDFQAIEPSEHDKELAVHIISVKTKQKEREQEEQEHNPDDELAWNADNKEFDSIIPEEWDVDGDLLEEKEEI